LAAAIVNLTNTAEVEIAITPIVKIKPICQRDGAFGGCIPRLCVRIKYCVSVLQYYIAAFL